MDRKGIFILVGAVLLMFLWPALVDKVIPPPPRTAPFDHNATLGNATVNTNTAPVTPPAAGNATASEGNGTVPEGNGTAPENNGTVVQPVPRPVLHPQAPETLRSFKGEDAEYIFTSRGGGIKEVRLNEHPIDTGGLNPNGNEVPEDNRVALNHGAPLPVFALWGTNQLLSLTGMESYDLEAIPGDDEPAGFRAVHTHKASGLKIVKEFRPGAGFEMTNVVLRIENHSTNQVVLPSLHIGLGTSTPAGMGKMSDPMYHGTFWFDGTTDTHWEMGDFANSTLGCFPGTPIEQFTAGNRNVRWAAVHNQFYTLIGMVPDGVQLPDTVTARNIDHGPEATIEERAQNRYLVSVNYRNDGIVLPAKQGENYSQWLIQLDLYAGPKEYNQLEKLSRDKGVNQVDRVMDLGGFFGFFSKVLLLSMNALHGWGCSYAIAIIIITIIVKAIFWPLTGISTRSMKRMGKLQPQMKALQERYKDDPQKMNQKLMAFMKEHKVNPMAGCLPMLIQIPVFFGFFFMIRTAVELRGEDFLWIADLSQPDTVFIIPGINFIPFFSTAAGLPVNPMPILMGITMLIQARITPTSPGADEMQAKMMKYLPMIFILFLYNFSAGLTLYWTVQNVLSIAQTHMTKDEDDTDTGDANAAAKPAAKPTERKPRKKRR